jgi:LAS superfamily LD-carboxypeptidase LdcB
MKRILLICAAAVTVLSCAGCAEQNNPADISTPTEPLATQNGDVTQPTCVEHDCTTPAQTEAAVSTNEDTAPVVTTAEDTTEAATQSALETEALTETVTTIKVPEQTEAQTTNEVESEPQPEESGEEPIDKDYIYQDEDDFFYVVNKTYLLPEDYEIQTDYVQGSYEMEKTAAKHMREMIAAAKEDGINLKVLSAYRTVNYQKKLFERNVKSRMEDYGMSYEEAYYDTSINIAPPGGSEHNAGLAADIITENDWDTYTGFEDTDEFAWLQIHAPEHGFILRYLKGKEDITGYIYEPWHYRYVGVKYAQDIMDSGLCLEEYFEKYVWVDGVEPSFPFDS